MNKPANRDHASVRNFFEQENPPLLADDQRFIYEKEDLITLQPGREHAWLDGSVEWLIRKCHCKLIEVYACLISSGCRCSQLMLYGSTSSVLF